MRKKARGFCYFSQKPQKFLYFFVVLTKNAALVNVQSLTIQMFSISESENFENFPQNEIVGSKQTDAYVMIKGNLR